MRLSHLIIASCLAAPLMAPTGASAASVTGGRVAWLRLNCNGCHGDNAGGGMGPNIRGKESHDIYTAMTGDKRSGGMRSYVGVKEFLPTDPDDIAAYLATIGKLNEPKWHTWWLPH
jgi:cytochrome c551